MYIRHRILWLLTCSALLFLVAPVRADTATYPAIQDVYIDQGKPDDNFDNKTRVLIAFHPTKGIARGLWQFDLPTTLEPSQIDSAIMHVSRNTTAGDGYAIAVDVFALNVPFDEDNATWNAARPGCAWTIPGGDYDNSTFSSGTLPAWSSYPDNASIDLTALVQGNLDKVRDFGILMKLHQEGPERPNQNFATKEDAPPSFGAYLEIRFESETTTSSSSSSSSTTTSTSSGGGGGGGGSPKTTTSTSSSTIPTTTTTTSVPATTTSTSVQPPPPATTTTTANEQGQCAVTLLADRDTPDMLHILRTFRDRRLSRNAEGLLITYLYYSHSREAVAIMRADPALAAAARSIVRDMLPALAAAGTYDEALVVTVHQLEHITALVTAIKATASPGLNEAAAYILDRITDEAFLDRLHITIDTDL
jgi:hypothetical protein